MLPSNYISTNLAAIKPASAHTFSNTLFLRFIDYTDRKATTIKGYVTCIRQFARWIENNGIQEPRRDDIKAYRDYLSVSGLAVGTQAQYLRAVKHFLSGRRQRAFIPTLPTISTAQKCVTIFIKRTRCSVRTLCR